MLSTPHLRTFVALAASAILAACGTNVPAPAPAPAVSQAPAGLIQEAEAPITMSEAGAMSEDSSGHPRWKFYHALDVTRAGTFSVAPWYTQCYPTSGLYGPWYFSSGSFTLPNRTTALPSCTLYAGSSPYQGDPVHSMFSGGATPTPSPSPTPAPTATPSPTPTPTPTATPTPNPNIESPDNLYIVRVDVTSSGIQVGAIAGPAQVTPTQFVFSPLVNGESFQNLHFYEFYVAKYLDTKNPVPIAH